MDKTNYSVQEDRINEETNALIKVVLYDENNSTVPGSALSSLTMTLYDKNDESIINNREDIDAKNANGGTIDESGNFTFLLTPQDTKIIHDELKEEIHVCLLEFGYGAGRQGKLVVEHYIRNLVKVP